jgi:hypothetical protein
LIPQKLINVIIFTVVILAIAGAMYPTIDSYVTNITTTTYCVAGNLGRNCNGSTGWGVDTAYSNTALLVIIRALYWILISAGLVIYWVKSVKVK